MGTKRLYGDDQFLFELDPPILGKSVIMNPYLPPEPVAEITELEVPEPEEQSYIDCFYVVENLAVQGKLQVREYDTLFLAMQAYNDLPTDKRKALGIRNTQPLPGSLDFLQCIDGVDTVVEDYLKVEGWQNEEILGAVRQIEKHMKKEPKELAPPAPKPRERAASTVLLPSIPDSERSSFRIRDDDLGVGTPGQRYANNVAAIRLLKKLEAEERLATPEEQEVLSQYVGWGGLSHWFDDRHPKYQELKDLLTVEEYATARESTLTAFYTPPVVIRAMYQALENMNFRNGNILEPSCGIGNFIGMLPDSMSASKLYGVELDSISGRIAQQLYQKSSIAVQGYEKTELPDSFFDAAIGNVPFGQFKVSDKRYDKHNFLIHDFFFARTLDKVRPGGIIAFITSKGTMDKENPAVRKYIAQRAELLGAIRLPNNTFKSAAGTEVTSDILFLQKRDRLVEIEPDWVHLGMSDTGLKMNQYFLDHPEMVLGEMQEVSGPYGPETACVPYADRELGDLLSNAIRNIHADFVEYELSETPEDWEDLTIPADPSVRNFSYTLVEGTVYYRENSRMHPVELSAPAANRLKGLIGIRDSVRKLIDYQTEDYPDSMIEAEQTLLNELYDSFQEKYGRINSRANNSAFNADSSFCLLSSLEILDDGGNFLRKADMFTKRTIRQKVVVTSVDTASEALALSLAEKAQIDMEYMSGLTGKTEEQLYEDLQGVIFLNPDYAAESDGRVKYLPADEYLSGNVREKLAQVNALAKHEPETFASHLKALEAVQPVDLTASEISVRLGATWLPVDVVQDFMFQLLGTPFYMRWNIHVRYSQYTGEWNIEGKSVDRNSVQAHSTYGTSRVNAYKIIEETLNLRDVRVFDYIDDGHGKRVPVLNRKETAIAQSKQDQIKAAFADWIWEEPDRRERLTRLYNEKFNSIRPREYDGKLSEIWTLITQSPQSFRGGAIWSVVLDIHATLQAIGYGLLVLFFVMGVMKTCGSFAELKRPEHAIKLFVRFAISKGVITYGLELMNAVQSIILGVVGSIMNAGGFGTPQETVLPDEIIAAVEAAEFFESIPLWAVTLIGGLLIWVLSFTMIMTVYGRFFRLYMYTAIAPLPLAAFAGEPTQSVGISFLKSYAAVCLEGAIIVLACIIFSIFAASPPTVDPTAAAATMVWDYIGELIFNMLVLVGTVKMADRVVREMMGL